MIPITHDITRLVGTKCVYDVYGVPAPALITKVSYNLNNELKISVKPDIRRKVRWSYMPFWNEEETTPDQLYKNFTHFYKTNKRFDPGFVNNEYVGKLNKIIEEANIASILLEPPFNGNGDPHDLEVKLWLLICKVNASSKRLTALHSQLREINNNENIKKVKDTFFDLKEKRLRRHKVWIALKRNLGEAFFKETLTDIGYNESLHPGRYFFTPNNHYFELDFYFKKDRWCASCRVTFSGRVLEGSKEAEEFFKIVEREEGLTAKIKPNGFTIESYKSLAALYREVEKRLQDICCPVDMEEVRSKLRFDLIENADPIYVNVAI